MPDLINNRIWLIVTFIIIVVSVFLFYWNNRSIPVPPMYSPTIIGTYPITVDYNKSLDEMIAWYHEGWWGRYVDTSVKKENFLVNGVGIVNIDVILVRFNHGISDNNARKELAAMGLEPARIEHAAAFGQKYPEAYRNNPIYFLGSPRGYKPILVTMWFNARWLDLDFETQPAESDCSSKCLFAATRIVSSTP